MKQMVKSREPSQSLLQQLQLSKPLGHLFTHLSPTEVLGLNEMPGDPRFAIFCPCPDGTE